MKLGIDIRSTLRPKRTGIGQYTFNLLNSLAKIDHHSQYQLYSQIRPFSRKSNPKISGRNFHFFTERLRHRPNLFFKRINLYHSSSSDLIPPRDKKFVLTIHDVIVKAFPEGHPQDAIARVSDSLSRALERVDGLIVSSENTKKDVLKWFKFSEHKIRVIHLGAGENFFPLKSYERSSEAKLLRAYGIKDKFILFVGTLEPRKNLENLIQAFKLAKDIHKIEHKLVIAGMWSRGAEKVFGLVNSLGLTKEVIFTGYVKQDRMNLLYNLAECFVYPSLYEGFGLPIVEAFHSGSAVITSNCSSCAEVAGEAALLTEPRSVEQMADALYRVITDRELNSELRKKAVRRAKDFSWEVAARKTLNFFNDIYRGSN